MRIPAILVPLLLGSSGCIRSGPAVEEPGSSLSPLLRWEAFPGRHAGDPVYRAATQVTYDLRIYRERDSALVYERRGLEAPRHTVDQVLDPGTEYRWTVRARFESGGRPHVGEWSRSTWGLSGLRSATIPDAMNLFEAFETPAAPAGT